MSRSDAAQTEENKPMLKWLVLPMAVLVYLASTVSAGAPRDRDHDRLPDRWEQKHNLSTAKPSAKRDPDRDRLRNRRELRLRTNPRRADTDRDHLRDGAEVRRFHTNPRKRDTDGDGFSDRCELRKGTNPRKRRSHPKRRCSKSPQKSPQEPPRRVPPPAPPELPPPSPNGVFGDSGSFHASCFYSHTAHDDPIVFPGQHGASHEHDFIGARLLDAMSTTDSIRLEPNNCVRTGGSHTTTDVDADESAYWVPALYVNDRKVVPGSSNGTEHVNAYYTTNRRHTASIRPFPPDFRAIAGVATGGPSSIGDQTVLSMSCQAGLAQPAAGPGFAPLCNTDGFQIHIKFGDCWDGRSDSPNHRDHLAYSQAPGGSTVRVCPSSHPIEVPSLTLQLKYPTRAGSTTRLASGDMRTLHADFMNGWDQTKLAQLTRDCLNANKYCGGSDAPVPGHP
jgi:Domain of unknown function (DUF1996)/Bacterial TSP3 repeat